MVDAISRLKLQCQEEGWVADKLQPSYTSRYGGNAVVVEESRWKLLCQEEGWVTDRQ